MAAVRFDLIVIGGGPAGEKAAAQAAYWHKRVALVEQAPRLGGTMVGGAVSSKVMREAALYLTGFQQRAVYDVGLDLAPEQAMARLRARTDNVMRSMTDAMSDNMARHGVEVVHGRGRLAGDGRVVVTAGGASRTLEAGVIVLATGTRASHPDGVAAGDPDVLDAEAASRLDRPLRDVVVIGGGAVGCEFASIFLALGAQVTLVDSGEHLLPFMDAELAGALREAFEAAGMRVIGRAGRAAVGRDDDGVRVEVAGELLRPETVVFAAGRAGATDGLGLDDAGVDVDARGRIVVDDRFETSAPGVYAVGDVIGPPALASVSMEQARVAVCHAFDIPFKRSVDPAPPFGVYSIPEVAMVGMTEAAVRAAEVPCAVGRARFADNARGAIAGTTDGYLKLVAHADDRRLLGAHLLGDSATELIHIGQVVMQVGGTIDHFIHTTFNVPTLSEAYKYAAYDCLRVIEAR